MKKMMFFLMMICLSASSWAQTNGNCGKVNAADVTWSYDAITNTLTIFGIGNMADFTSGAAPWNAYLSSITSVVIESGVTSIGNYAFKNCSVLTSVSIPSGVTSIGVQAFSGCSGLTSVIIPGSVTSIGDFVFYGCSGLTSVSIPSGVTSIGFQAFKGCSGLTSVSIPTSVISIGTRVFEGCSGLTTITVDASNATYRSTDGGNNECNAILSKDGKTLFAGCKTTTIPGGVTSIGNYVFYGCSGLTSVSIPSGVTSIGDYVFYGCSGLTSVSIPSGVTSIGDRTFADCSGLTSVSIPSGVTSIGNNAFQGCSGLTSVSIPSGVTSIGNLTFFNCSALTSVSIPGSVTSIGSSAFLGCSGLTSVYYNTTSPITYDSNWKLGSTASPARTLHIPAEATAAFTANGWTTDVFASISEDIYSGPCGTNVSWVLVDHTLTISGAGAMADYGSENAPWYSYSSRITSVVIESGVTSIGKYAFKNCSVLTSVSIPSGVTSIGVQAFFNCPALTSVSIPTSVTSIGTRVFEGCSGLTTITVDANNATYRSTGGDGNECNAILSKDGKTLIAGCKTTTIPSGVTSIGDRAFQSCSTLTSVSIPGSVTSIGSSAFYACSGLTSVSISIPSSVTSIGASAFAWCSALTSVSIPGSVTSIGNQAFLGCSGLTTITVDANNVTYRSTGGDGNECNAILSKDGKTLITGCQTTTIPSGVTGIGNYAFQSCTTLTSVSIPGGVTSIGNYAFHGCSGLTSVSIPSSVTSFGENAFAWCSALRSVIIPSGVTSIGNNAFYGCTALTDVYYNTTSPITYDANWYLGSTANPARTLHIPAGATTAFSGKGWTNSVFASISEDFFGSGTCGTNVSWVLVGNTLTISGSGKMADFTSGATPWNAYISSITSVVIESGVTSIGSYAFYACSGLTSVSISSGVTGIGASAFAWCSALTSVSIPGSVTSIGSYAFNYCSGLTSVSIPGSVTSIGDYVFSGCSGLTTITVDANNATYRSTDGVGNECNAILSKDGKTLITGCQTTTIPSGVTGIGASAFHGCSRLTSVSIPSSVTSIGSYAFYGCSGLTSVSISIPSSVTSIGASAFVWCSALTSVSIPSSVTSIGASAFRGCSGLTTITVDANNATYRSTGGDGNECNAILSKDGKTLIAGCKTTTIPSGVTSIGNYAFNYCPGLTSVSIPSSVTSFGASAFAWCSALTSVSIPGSVTSIGNQAFYGCTALTDVYYNTTSPITYDANWKLGSTDRTLHIPVGAKTAFSGWTQYFAAVKDDIVDVTAVTGLVYTGSAQTGVQAATGYNTVTGGTKTEAGNYTATASLADGYVWPDGTTAPKTIAWSIAQATNAWTTEPSIADYAYGATPSTPAAGAKSSETPEFGYYTEEACTNAVDLTNGKPAPGTYYMKAATAGTGNYTALSSVVAFHITNQIVTLNETGTDNGLTGKDAVKSDVTYARAFTAAKWSTICLPFALTSAQMGTAFGGSCEVAKLEGVSSGVLSFTSVTDMAAGTPYIIKFSGTAPTALTFKDVTIDKTDGSFTVGAGETCTMTGTSAVTDIPNNANHYIMQGNKIYRVATDDVKMAAFRAYLTYSESAGAPAKASALTFEVDGETTGIAGVSVDSNNEDDAWYTLGGQKLSKKPTANGIYICNGRKIIIK
jgi:hypothetical protein